ncbi:SpaA isopeptide-forming pilin-related protein [Bifidobacterium aquikefiri]
MSENAVVPDGLDVTVKPDADAADVVTVSRATSFTDAFITVEQGGYLLLDDLILDGNNIAATDTLIHVDGGSASMISGRLTGALGGSGEAQYGGSAVVVSGATGSFSMLGGEITANGHRVNESTDVGQSVVYVSDGVFSLGGGEISGNAISEGQAAIDFTNDARVDLYGGVIRANLSYGVIFDDGELRMWGTPRIEASHANAGLVMGDDDIISVIGDLSVGSRIDIVGKTGYGQDTVIAQKNDGSDVSKAEARYFRWKIEDFSVSAKSGDNTYILSALDVVYQSAVADGVAHMEDSDVLTLTFSNVSPQSLTTSMVQIALSTDDTKTIKVLSVSGPIYDEGDVDDITDDTWSYQVTIDRLDDDTHRWAEGDVAKVTVAKNGILFDPSSRNAELHHDDRIRVEYLDAVANGSSRVTTTTALTLSFDTEISNLYASDFSLELLGEYDDSTITATGVEELASSLDGENNPVYNYSLQVSGTWFDGDEVKVSVEKVGYVIAPVYQIAALHSTEIRKINEYVRVAANGEANAVRTSELHLFMRVDDAEMLAVFDVDDIVVEPGEDASDSLEVTVTGVSEAAVYDGTDEDLDDTWVYTVSIQGMWDEGDPVDVTVTKSGYYYIPEVRSTALHRGVASLVGHDFGIPLSKVSGLNALEVLQRAQVVAKDENTQDIPLSEVTVDSDALAALVSADASGSYPLGLSILDADPEDSETAEITAYVYDDSTSPVTKQIVNDDGGDGFDLGSEVEFELSARVPDLFGSTQAYDDYDFALSDVLNGNLSVPDDDGISVFVGDSDVDVSDQLDIDVDDRTITVDGIKELFAVENDATSHIENDGSVLAGSYIRVRFLSTILTSLAEGAESAHLSIDNTATMTASSVTNPDTPDTAQDTATVHTYGVDAVKTDKDNLTALLAGATFTVTRMDADGQTQAEPLKFVSLDGQGTYRLAVTDDGDAAVEEVVSGNAGVLRLVGMEAGNLVITETIAPDGYFLLGSFNLHFGPIWSETDGSFVAVRYVPSGSPLVTVISGGTRLSISNASFHVRNLPYTGGFAILVWCLSIGVGVTLVGTYMGLRYPSNMYRHVSGITLPGQRRSFGKRLAFGRHIGSSR